MASAIRLRPVKESELRRMVQIDFDAFREEPVRIAFFPDHLKVGPGDTDITNYYLPKVEKAFKEIASGENRRSKYIAAVQDAAGDGAEEEMLGWAEWLSPDDSETLPPPKSDEERMKEIEAMLLEDIPGMDKNTLKKQIAGTAPLRKARDEAVGGRENVPRLWTLNSISVDPKHQRKGVGKALVQWGIDRATEEGKDIWLFATNKGKPLYLSLGFKVLEELPRDTAMLWKAPAAASSSS